MSGDLVTLVSDLSPYVTAAVSAYGGAVLAKTQEEAADVTVSWGRKILQRIFGVSAEVPEAVADLVAEPEDEDLQAALRARIRKLLAADAGLAAEVEQMLGQAREQTVIGQVQMTANAYNQAQQAVLGQGTMNVKFGSQNDRQSGSPNDR